MNKKKEVNSVWLLRCTEVVIEVYFWPNYFS